MPEFRQLADDFSVCGQLSVYDMEDLANAGFRAVIFNRPDGEGGPAQPMTSDLIVAAEDAGLSAIHLPMAGQLSEALIADTARVVMETDGPVLGCCASGMRSAALWAFTTTASLSVDEIMSRLSNAGYALDHLRPMLMRYAETS